MSNPAWRTTDQTLAQPPDTLQASEADNQRLRIRIEDAGAGAFAVLSTRRWAIDKDDLAGLMERIAGLIEAHDAAVEDEQKKRKGS